MTSQKACHTDQIGDFAERVSAWAKECFGSNYVEDTSERNLRFLEEAIELVQACDFTQDEAHRVVDYVYGRQSGEVGQEVGGVVLTLILLCKARGIQISVETEKELKRIESQKEEIISKQNMKPRAMKSNNLDSF